MVITAAGGAHGSNQTDALAEVHDLAI